MKKVITLLALCAMLSSVWAEANYTDQIIEKSDDSKRAGVALVVSGILMVGGGSILMAGYDREPDETKLEAGIGAVGMGAVLAAGGITFDIIGIRKLKESKQILKDAQEREGVPVTLRVSPRELAFSIHF